MNLPLVPRLQLFHPRFVDAAMAEESASSLNKTCRADWLDFTFGMLKHFFGSVILRAAR